jgi:hypothetical protein
MKARAWFAALLAAIVLVAAPAAADPAADAFNEGMKLMAQGSYEPACAAFERSEGAGGQTIATRYQLGRCNEERGHFASALIAFRDAARLADEKGDKKRADVARERIAELEGKVAKLAIVVPPDARVAGLEIKRDGELVPPELWNAAVPVDPGVHEVDVTVPGAEPVKLRAATDEPGATKTVEIPVIQSGVKPPATPENVDEEPPTRRRSSALFWTGVGLTIAGGLAVIGGAVTLGLCQNDPTVCDGEDTPPGSIIALVAGGVFLGVGIPFMVVFGSKVPVEADEPNGDEPSGEEPRNEGRVDLLLGPTAGALRVTF